MLAAAIAIKGLPMLHMEDKVAFALQCMEDFDVQHLAVVKDDYFIGLISKSDLLDTDTSNNLEKLSIESISSSNQNYQKIGIIYNQLVKSYTSPNPCDFWYIQFICF